MRRIVNTKRNDKGEITSQEVIKPKQLSTFIPFIPGEFTKKMVFKCLMSIHTDIRYSGKEKGFYVN